MDFGNVKQLVIGFRGTFDEDIAMLDWRSAEGFILVEYYNCADAMHAERTVTCTKTCPTVTRNGTVRPCPNAWACPKARCFPA